MATGKIIWKTGTGNIFRNASTDQNHLGRMGLIDGIDNNCSLFAAIMQIIIAAIIQIIIAGYLQLFLKRRAATVASTSTHGIKLKLQLLAGYSIYLNKLQQPPS
jgi:uncharacterized membrane protein